MKALPPRIPLEVEPHELELGTNPRWEGFHRLAEDALDRRRQPLALLLAQLHLPARQRVLVAAAAGPEQGQGPGMLLQGLRIFHFGWKIEQGEDVLQEGSVPAGTLAFALDAALAVVPPAGLRSPSG